MWSARIPVRLQRPGYHYFYHFPLTVNDVSQDVLGVIQQYWYLIESARSEESNEPCSRSRTPIKSGRKAKRTGKMMRDSNGDACQFDPCTWYLYTIFPSAPHRAMQG